MKELKIRFGEAKKYADELMNTPWTWGTYLKAAAAVGAVYAIIALIAWVWCKIQERKLEKSYEEEKKRISKKYAEPATDDDLDFLK